MSTTQEDAREATSNPSRTIKTSVSIYFTLLAGGFLVFECVRRRFRRAYDSRGVEGNACWTASAAGTVSKWPLGWTRAVFLVSDDEILERCGLDTLFFLRFLRMGKRIALLAVALSVVLFPVYATAPSPPQTPTSTNDPLAQITMANVPTHDPRLWASVVAVYVVCSFTMYLLLEEYRHYVERRHELLMRPVAPVYSILMNDLPLKLRSRQTLERYMRKLFPDAVRCVYVAVECGKLEALEAKRERVRNALEHALAMAENMGIRPQHRQSGGAWYRKLLCLTLGDRWVDSIDWYQEELAKLNEKVARESSSLDLAQARLAQAVDTQEQRRLPRRTASLSASGDRSLARQIESMWGLEESQAQRAERGSEQPGMGDQDTAYEDAEVDENDPADAKCSGDEDQERVRQLHPVRVMRRAAFVSFTSLMAAQVAQQTVQSRNPTRMSVQPAPHVSDVNWGNIGLQQRSRSAWQLISVAITAAIVLFWTIPTAFVASLSTVDSLRRTLPFLDSAFDKYPFLEQVFKQIAPLALVALSALAPIIFRFLAEREGYPSNTEVRASVFHKLAYFQLIQIFFVTVVVGTVLDSLKAIVDQPKTLLSMLGRSMPQQSTFFMSYVIVLTGLGLVLELLRVVPIVSASLFACFAPKLTRRERNSSWYGLSTISNTEAFDPTALFADGFLVILITLTFAPIAPLVCYFTAWYFLVSETVFRRQVLYVYKSTAFAMGAYWPRLYKFLIVALVVSQLALIGLLSLKKAPIPLVFVLVLLVGILVFHRYISALYPRVAKYLPLTNCVRIDEIRRQRDRDATFYFLDNVYQQPAMRLTQRQPLHADHRMLADVNDHDALLLSPEIPREDERVVFTALPA